MNALTVALLIGTTAILSVVFGIFGSYYAIYGVLAAVKPSQPSTRVSTLVPHQSHASGD